MFAGVSFFQMALVPLRVMFWGFVSGEKQAYFKVPMVFSSHPACRNDLKKPAQHATHVNPERQAVSPTLSPVYLLYSL